MAKSKSRSLSAFTLIELLVVIAIIALLIAILLPGLGQARKVGRQLREGIGASQADTAHGLYMNEYKDAPIVGYSAWSWAHPYTGTDTRLIRVNMFPPDLDDPKIFNEGSAIKFHGLRFRGFAGFSPDAWQIDKNLLATFKSRPRTAMATPYQGWFGPYVSPVQTEYQGAMAIHPSWGLNTVYVGGDYLHGAFNSSNVPGSTRNSGSATNPIGKFYLANLAEINQPSKLIFCASSRAADVTTWQGSWYYASQSDADGQSGNAGRIVPGYYKILPPKPCPSDTNFSDMHAPAMNSGWGTQNGTNENNVWDAKRAPSYFGYLDGRHFGKPVTAMMDGHVENLSLEQLRDMTRWSNYASDRNWAWHGR